VVVPVTNGSLLLADAVRDLDAAGLRIDDLALRRPTLDDVFLTLTGHAAEDRGADSLSHSKEEAPTGALRSDQSGRHTASNERIRA
jgi:ABC-2 type transport system ATP-binding protein